VTLAAIRGQAGDLEGARRLLGRATEAAPLDVRAAVALAGTLRDLGRPEEAAAALRPILEKRPDSLPVLRMLAHCLGAAGRWSEAVEVLRHANEVHPGIPGLMNDLGVALFEGAFWKNEWLSEAIRVHEEALRIAPGDVNNSYNLARAYTKLNKTEGLLRNIDLYEGIIARIQGDPRQVDLLRRCHRNVALILSDSFKRYEEAYAHYLEFFRLGGRAEDDPSGGILDDWGKVLEGLGKPYRAPPGPGESK
jgi:protein O-GlcNAc transferase